MTDAMIDLYCASYARPPTAVTLDIDDTPDIVHGRQQLSLFNSHYGERCSGGTDCPSAEGAHDSVRVNLLSEDHSTPGADDRHCILLEPMATDGSASVAWISCCVGRWPGLSGRTSCWPSQGHVRQRAGSAECRRGESALE